ncbi:MAG: hypothetical protein KBT36_08960 [Kurthia sp.]|nr:hypothetical protein [Candidatus Kurthia equi]
MAKLTLIGLNNYLQYDNTSLFNEMKLPKGIDRNVLVNTILLNSSEFEVLYPDAYFCKEVINNICEKWYYTFEKWIKVLNIDYDPLNNYDRKEEWEDSVSGTIKDTGSVTNVSESNQDNKVSAFNSSVMQDNDSSSFESSNTSTNNLTKAENTKTIHKARLYGNIGVTTSQQLREAELSTVEWNLYEHMSDIFLKELVIPVY